jgi:hypothetical protein
LGLGTNVLLDSRAGANIIQSLKRIFPEFDETPVVFIKYEDCTNALMYL